MINYTPQNQLSLELFEHPFETELDKDNRWVKLAGLIPWDSLASVYSRKLNHDSGRKSIDIRIVIASIIIKHKLCLDDRGTVQMISENIYLQYFCGLKSFTTKPVFDPSLFVDIRKRLGGNEFATFNKLVIEKSEELKPHQARIIRKSNNNDNDDYISSQNKNRGTLKVDATVADQEVTFPTDLKLLNEARDNTERIIDLLYKPQYDEVKPRTYRRIARKDYLNVVKKKQKSNKEIRHGIKKQLQYLRRDLKIVDDLTSKPDMRKLLKRDKEILETIKEVFNQQEFMYKNKTHKCDNRIVNLYQPHVRPIVRGKDKNKTEFGSKINISEVEGFCRIDRFSWLAYNEGVDVKLQVENYMDLYKCYPKYFLADRIYLTRANRKYLKGKGIMTLGKPLGRPSKKETYTAGQKYRRKKKLAERKHVEGKFGQAKRGYGLNNIQARLADTSESWINAIFFIMNLTKLMKVADKWGNYCLYIFKQLLKMTKGIFNRIFSHNDNCKLNNHVIFA